MSNGMSNAIFHNVISNGMSVRKVKLTTSSSKKWFHNLTSLVVVVVYLFVYYLIAEEHKQLREPLQVRFDAPFAEFLRFAAFAQPSVGKV